MPRPVATSESPLASSVPSTGQLEATSGQVSWNTVELLLPPLTALAGVRNSQSSPTAGETLGALSPKDTCARGMARRGERPTGVPDAGCASVCVKRGHLPRHVCVGPQAL